MLGEYGDDSVAQLAGVHVACEWVSNLLTKMLERPRLGAYLEQSTRYIAFDRPVPGLGYRYHRDRSSAGVRAGDGRPVRATTGRRLRRSVRGSPSASGPRPGTSAAAHERARPREGARSARGLLPAATLSHVGIFASGQTFERLVMHLRAEELPEAREAAGADARRAAGRRAGADDARRPPRPRRRLERRTCAGAPGARRMRRRSSASGGLAEAAPAGADVRLLHVEGDEQLLLRRCCSSTRASTSGRSRPRSTRWQTQDRAALLGELLSGRENRRHLPGRGLEALRYRFEIVSDYGAFRDLQRHRMLTVQWQALGPAPRRRARRGGGRRGPRGEFRGGVRALSRGLAAAGGRGPRAQAAYALCLAFRIRYVLDMNAREAMHLIELRSGREGHASYRTIAARMHELIAAVHPAVAAAMTHLDNTVEPRLERMPAELRGDERRVG